MLLRKREEKKLIFIVFISQQFLRTGIEPSIIWLNGAKINLKFIYMHILIRWLEEWLCQSSEIQLVVWYRLNTIDGFFQLIKYLKSILKTSPIKQHHKKLPLVFKFMYSLLYVGLTSLFFIALGISFYISFKTTAALTLLYVAIQNENEGGISI